MHVYVRGLRFEIDAISHYYTHFASEVHASSFRKINNTHTNRRCFIDHSDEERMDKHPGKQSHHSTTELITCSTAGKPDQTYFQQNTSPNRTSRGVANLSTQTAGCMGLATTHAGQAGPLSIARIQDWLTLAKNRKWFHNCNCGLPRMKLSKTNRSINPF